MDQIKIVEHLRSGTMLTPDEEDLVQREITILMGLDAEIGHLEGEIARLNTQLTSLKVKQQQKDSRSALLTALHAPVRRLPPDVLREIFIHCSPQQTTESSHRDPPLLFGQVCCLWRKVSIHTPALWSNLPVLWDRRCVSEVRNKKSRAKPATTGVFFAALWLARSGTLPLTVTIPPRLNILDDIKPLLLSYSHRFNKLDIDLSQASWLLGACDLFPYYRLTEIVVTDISSYSEAPPVDLRLAAPNLKSAKFCLRTLAESPGRIGVVLCWEQLSHLSLECACARDTFKVLSQCHNIIDMALLDIESDGELESLRPDPIVLPTLRSLRYTGRTFLDYLVLPNLQTFSCAYDSCGWPKTSFLSLISRSSCDIRCFHFETKDEEVPEEEQIELVQSLPHLQTFTIIDVRLPGHKERAIFPQAAELVAGWGGSDQKDDHPKSFA